MVVPLQEPLRYSVPVLQAVLLQVVHVPLAVGELPLRYCPVEQEGWLMHW